jgi:hypothetical protein
VAAVASFGIEQADDYHLYHTNKTGEGKGRRQDGAEAGYAGVCQERADDLGVGNYTELSAARAALLSFSIMFVWGDLG